MRSNRKIQKVTIAVISALFVLGLFSTGWLPVVAGQSSQCSINTINEMQMSLEANLNTNIARSLAVSSSEYGTLYSEFGLQFSSIFNTWTFSLSACTVEWDTVNVVFRMPKPDGSSFNFVVSENPQLTQVLSTKLEQTFGQLASQDSPNWSGYEYEPTTNGHPSGVTYVVAYWSVPSVSYTTTLSGVDQYCSDDGYGTNTCVASVWIGASPAPAGRDNYSPQFGQVGTLSDLVCNSSSSCSSPSTSYVAFYDFPNANYVEMYGVSAGDSMEAVITYSSGNFYGSMYDLTHSNSYTTNPTSMVAPLYAEFIMDLEQAGTTGGPFFLPYYDPLPQFQGVVVSGAEINSGAIIAYTPSIIYHLNASGTTQPYNIKLSGVSNSRYLGSWFSETWQTSVYT